MRAQGPQLPVREPSAGQHTIPPLRYHRSLPTRSHTSHTSHTSHICRYKECFESQLRDNHPCKNATQVECYEAFVGAVG